MYEIQAEEIKSRGIVECNYCALHTKKVHKPDLV